MASVSNVLPWILWSVTLMSGNVCDGFAPQLGVSRLPNRHVARKREVVVVVSTDRYSPMVPSCSTNWRRMTHGNAGRSMIRTITPLGATNGETTPHSDDTGAASATGPLAPLTSNPTRSVLFSICMSACGATLGPFLDSYHSSFGVLSYDRPFTLALWSSDPLRPALTTTWWVPPLFGLAGFLIGWLYILLDAQTVSVTTDTERANPSVSFVLLGIAVFTFQYYLSGVFFSYQIDRTTIFLLMTLYAGIGFYTLDRTIAGFLTSLATAIGGPLIEVGLLSSLAEQWGGYHYNDPGETGFFPLWIVPVYFLGGPPNGNLARAFWNGLSRVLVDATTVTEEDGGEEQSIGPCNVCNDTRAVPCPNCDGKGDYVTYGQTVLCKCCRGSGRVICRACFDRYGEDPADIEAIRDFMARMPD